MIAAIRKEGIDWHWEALRTSSMLTESYRLMYRPESAMVKAEKVIRVLNNAGIHFVVMGTHGISGYRDEPRATQDVDVLVRARDHRRAIAAIKKAFPKLGVMEGLVVTRFIDPSTQKVVIDLMKPYMELYKLVFKNSVVIGEDYHIPTLEMALTSKYAAMISPNRTADKKHIDAGDFINMVRTHSGEIDLKKLAKLAETIYQGAGSEIVEYVNDAEAGRTLKI